ncbi:MAG TPA: hypothetical protein VH279_04295 [Solirubrobacteraceae bacterium]|nr:hypothetical protein [Solirubrobacteraceae bacterium]
MCLRGLDNPAYYRLCALRASRCFSQETSVGAPTVAGDSVALEARSLVFLRTG